MGDPDGPDDGPRGVVAGGGGIGTIAYLREYYVLIPGQLN